MLTIECWDQAPGLPAIGQDGKCVYAGIPLRSGQEAPGLNPATSFPIHSQTTEAAACHQQ